MFVMVDYVREMTVKSCTANVNCLKICFSGSCLNATINFQILSLDYEADMVVTGFAEVVKNPILFAVDDSPIHRLK